MTSNSNNTQMYALYTTSTGGVLGLYDIPPNVLESGTSLLQLSDSDYKTLSSLPVNKVKIIDEIVTIIPDDPAVILQNAKTLQITKLNNYCNNKILSGFLSINNLTFTSDDNSQRNILQVAQSSKGGVLTTMNTDGSTTRNKYNQTQGQQILEDFVEFRGDLEMILSSLEDTINTATTTDQVVAIVWPTSTTDSTSTTTTSSTTTDNTTSTKQST